MKAFHFTLNLLEGGMMRLSPLTAVCSLACVFFSTGPASARTVTGTIDGAPVTRAIVQEGRIRVPFRTPMEKLRTVVAWSGTDQTGMALSAGHELDRTIAGASKANVGYRKILSVAPVLIDPQHLGYVPVQISTAPMTLAADATSATSTNADLADVNAAGSAASSNDPDGKVLLVWLWLLPLSGILSLAAYVVAIGQLNRSFAAAAARRGKPIKPLGLFV